MNRATSACHGWLRLVVLIEVLLPPVVLLALTRDLRALVVPFAGPWAARVFGHSCGIDGQAPVAAWGLLAFGAASIALVCVVRRPLALLPAALLWWPAWLLSAVISAANAHE